MSTLSWLEILDRSRKTAYNKQVMTEQQGDQGRKATLGERIRELRLKRGWTQQQLAERVGIQQKQISSYERGANVPSGQTFIALAEAFGVSLDYLAQISPHSSAQAAIADLDLLEKVQRVDRLDEHERTLVKDVMDLVVLKSTVRQLAAGETRPSAEATLAEVQAQAS
jgi:transcriptional regulator with XRE-family HTH domain